VTGKVAEANPCGTVTLEGTLAAAVLELESDTAAPPVPAGSVRLTVPVADWPPTMLVGLTETPLRAPGSGLIVMPRVALKPR